MNDYRTSIEWTAPDGKRYRITEDKRPLAATAGNVNFVRVLWRHGADDGWTALAKWRSLEDGPTFGGLANIVMTAFGAATFHTYADLDTALAEIGS